MTNSNQRSQQLRLRRLILEAQHSFTVHGDEGSLVILRTLEAIYAEKLKLIEVSSAPKKHRRRVQILNFTDLIAVFENGHRPRNQAYADV